MNASEKKTALMIAQVMRASRKLGGLSQNEVAKKLGVSQGSLSKFESGALIPSAHHWVEFCSFLKVPTVSYLDGYIDRKNPVVLRDVDRIGGFKIPSRYGKMSASTSRSSRPMLQFFERELGSKHLSEFLEAKKMDPDLLYVLDVSYNVQFNMDIASHLIAKGALKSKNFSKLFDTLPRQKNHGFLHESYDQARDAMKLLEFAISSLNYYDRNASYQLIDAKAKQITVSVKNEKHTREFEASNEGLADFLCQYRKGWLQSMSRYGNHEASQIKERQCMYSGAESCVYQIALPA